MIKIDWKLWARHHGIKGFCVWMDDIFLYIHIPENNIPFIRTVVISAHKVKFLNWIKDDREKIRARFV